ncbi:hypothetical protein BN871_CB_00070 [Paenibacillus sp. P22]|nr:hypothetical protein BN871_CB_00070 [Paenibacillus sp. P22]
MHQAFRGKSRLATSGRSPSGGGILALTGRAGTAKKEKAVRLPLGRKTALTDGVSIQ